MPPNPTKKNTFLGPPNAQTMLSLNSYTHLILFDNMLASMFNQEHPRRTVHPEEDHKSRRPGEAPTAGQFKGTKAKLQRKVASPLLDV